jgi:transposase
MALLAGKHQPVEVARMLGVDRRSVRRWKSAYRFGGYTAIKARPVSGRPMKLGRQTLGWLAGKLLKGARAAGYANDLWTCPRIARVIEAHCHVKYEQSGVWRLMRGMGWSPQKPERRAMEANNRLIRRWLKHEWPRIKKKPAD